MQETQELIPAMSKLNSIIAEINQLLDQKGEVSFSELHEQGQPEHKHKFWIAGGAVTAAITGAEINDFDVFSPDPEALVEALKSAVGFTTFETMHFTNFLISGKKVQVIKRYAPASAEAIFNTFDFTIVCGAYDGKIFFCHDRFWQDIASKRLVINELYFPLSTLERMTKYAARGYKPCPVGLLNLAKTINAMQINWDSPDENLLTFYSDGTPRFTGVD